VTSAVDKASLNGPGNKIMHTFRFRRHEL